MASILKGAPVVAAMNERNAALCEQLKAKSIVPTLAVVRVGAREDDLSYERGVMTRCGKVGVEVKQYLLPADAAQDDLLKVIAEINADDAIHGCLLFRPLPKQFDDRTVRAALAPEKDIDGITDGSLAGVFTNTDLGYAPCTAQACLEILKHYNVPLSGKRAVVVGRSLVVGKPAAMMLDRENATVTICNSRTQDLPQICQEADVVVVAMGRMGAVGADCLRPGQTVVDVGTGAGFPGMPMKILEPSIQLTLLDSLGKRITFLQEVCDNLGLTDVQCVHARAEEFAAEHRQSFDFAVSRAVANLSVLSELCLPLVKPGGYFLSMKSVESGQELEAAKKAIQILGGRVERTADYQIPGTDVTHRVIFIKKIAETPKKYPRPFAKIKKNPL